MELKPKAASYHLQSGGAVNLTLLLKAVLMILDFWKKLNGFIKTAVAEKHTDGIYY